MECDVIGVGRWCMICVSGFYLQSKSNEDRRPKNVVDLHMKKPVIHTVLLERDGKNGVNECSR